METEWSGRIPIGKRDFFDSVPTERLKDHILQYTRQEEDEKRKKERKERLKGLNVGHVQWSKEVHFNFSHSAISFLPFKFNNSVVEQSSPS